MLWKIWLAAGLGATVSPAIGVAVFAALAIAGGIIMSRLVEYPLMRLIRGRRSRRPTISVQA